MSLVGSIWSGRLAYALHDIASYIDILFLIGFGLMKRVVH